MIKSDFGSLILLISIFFTSPSHAEGNGFLGLSLGYYNILDSNNESESFRIEYRPEKPFLFKNLKPWLGLEATLNGSTFGGAGLLWEISPTHNFFITPSFGAGLYVHGGDDDDLYHPIQFRTQIEFAYALKNESRIALGFSHMSNAGLGDRNPGLEVLSLYYYMPINKILQSPYI